MMTPNDIKQGHVDWSKVDWLDVGLHVLVASVITVTLAIVVGGVAVGMVVLASLTVMLVFYLREAYQHEGLNPFKWGWGGQMEFYAPAAVCLLVIIVTLVIDIVRG